MISLETIEREISELETRDASYRLCERLSWLYVVRDHLKGVGVPNAQLVPELDGSDFLRECSNKPTKAILEVMDEFVQTLALTYPTTYDTLMAKIRSVM